jgi:hypothetical protein
MKVAEAIKVTFDYNKLPISISNVTMTDRKILFN